MKKIMGKLKTFFSNISNSLKETFKKFPITIIIVYFTTLVWAFGTDDFVETFLNDMWFFMMITKFASVFLNPIRKIMFEKMGNMMFDFSPLILFLIIDVVKRIVIRLF